MMADLPVADSSGSRSVLKKAALEEFRSGLHGRIILPGESAYEGARKIWNGMIDRKPGLIVQCRGADDVISCINLAREEDILLAVRGGGHNVAGNAVCEGGLVIDLSEMRSVRTDVNNHVVHIEGGATLGDVDRETSSHGMATPMGVVTATGYAGLTLHGGMGWQLRKHGLASDNVLGVDIVTADGSLLRANAGENPDLFWAVRGGGGNFGVVTSFSSGLHPVPEEVLFSVFVFSLDNAAAVLRFMRDYMAEAPDELMVLAALWTAPDLPDIPPQHRGSHVLFVLGCYIGPPGDAEAFVKPLRTCRPTVADLSSRKSWVEVQKFFDEDYPPGRRYYWKSTLIKGLTDPVIEAVVRQTASRPSMLTSIDIWPMGGAFGRVDPAATAFGSRDVAFTVNYESNWDDADNDQANIQWTRTSLKEVQDLSQARTYLNFAGLAEDMEKMVRGSFGDNFSRLQAIKAKYDPANLFRTNFNISPGKKGS
ncbi:MAG: FAD-binding oxidoreductase [Candidatus Sulfobium sp.]|jgi:FAD/FMN-containing dehydrogenase